MVIYKLQSETFKMTQIQTFPKFCVLSGEKYEDIVLPSDFIEYDNHANNYANAKKYTVASNAEGKILKICDNKDTNAETCYMLSCIQKKSNKCKYYIIKESYNQVCKGCGSTSCSSHFCRGAYSDEYWYSSQYVGENIQQATEAYFKLLQ